MWFIIRSNLTKMSTLTKGNGHFDEMFGPWKTRITLIETIDYYDLFDNETNQTLNQKGRRSIKMIKAYSNKLYSMLGLTQIGHFDLTFNQINHINLTI
jgi:hypothetical protein